MGPEYFQEPLRERRAPFEARELPADLDLGDALCRVGFSLRGATVVVVDPQGAESVGPKTLSGLQSAGAKALVYPHPHQSGGHLVRVNFSGKGALRRLIDIGKLKARAIASWSMAEVRHVRGFSYVIGPFNELPALEDRELSHQVMVFKGKKQLPPVPSTHESISTQGGGRYSVWNQHVFFSLTENGSAAQLGKAERYWAVENNAKNAALLPMTINVSESRNLPASEFITRLEKYLDVISSRGSQLVPTRKNLKRIVVLTHALTPGGAERQWCYLAIGLKRLGYDVKFVSYDWLEGEKAHYQKLLASHGVEVYELGRVGIGSLMRTLASDPAAHPLLVADGNPLWIRLAQLVTLLIDLRPAAILAQLDPVNVLAGIAGTMAGTSRIILSFRNVNPSNFSYLRNDWFLPAYRALIRNPSIVLSGNSRAGNEDYAKWIGVSKDRVKYITNAVSDEMIGQLGDGALSNVVGALDVSSTTPLILGVFRLSEEKRPFLFLDVCEKVKSAVPDTRVLIAGVGPMYGELTAAIQQREIGDYVSLLGRRTDVWELMRLSSLLLLTSSFEGTPNVVLEAQALGVPVVATSVGGVPDVVIDGETGFLADLDDKDALVKACVRILQDENLRTRMREAARSRIAKSFTVESMVKHYLGLLQGINSRVVVAEN
jgi:glycosyltransferase involved in cell wall biosynthesis